MTVCNICVESYTRKGEGRERFNCPNCSDVACVACVERWVTERESKDDPKCMHCKKEIPDTAFVAAFGEEWTEESVRAPRLARLLAAERHALPTLEIQRRTSADAQRELDALEKAILDLQQQLKSANEKRADVKLKLIESMPARKRRRKAAAVMARSGERDLIPCQTCPGFMVENEDKQLTCKLCAETRCKDCWQALGRPAGAEEAKEVSDHIQTFLAELLSDEEEEVQMEAGVAKEEHECPGADVENISFIRSSAKICPGCGHAVHRTQGCAHMTCRVCGAKWNWNTGRLTSLAPDDVSTQLTNRSSSFWRREPRALIAAQAYVDADIAGIRSLFLAVEEEYRKASAAASRARKHALTKREKLREQAIAKEINAEQFAEAVSRLENERRRTDEAAVALEDLVDSAKKTQRAIQNTKNVKSACKRWQKAVEAFNKKAKLVVRTYGKSMIYITSDHKITTQNRQGKKRGRA